MWIHGKTRGRNKVRLCVAVPINSPPACYCKLKCKLLKNHAFTALPSIFVILSIIILYAQKVSRKMLIGMLLKITIAGFGLR